MHRRDFLKTLAAAATVAGAGRLIAGDDLSMAVPVADGPAPWAPEYHIHGNPYAFAAGAHDEFSGSDYGLAPIAAHALPAEWRDRYLLGIGT